MPDEDSEDRRLGQRFAHRYLIESKLGRGGFGQVYLALDVTNSRKVAIKVLNDCDDEIVVERFKREGEKFGAVFRHPNVVEILGFGAYEEQLYIASEFVEGRTLATILESQGAFAPDEALRVGRDVAGGLLAGHQAGAVHRDLKPANIMLRDADRLVKVLDFGIAKDLLAPITKSKEYLGTLGYSAPEQTLGSDIDHRADIFALGVILYELLTGTPPFRGSSTGEIVAATRHQSPVLASRLNDQVTRPVAELIADMMRKRPSGRPKDMAAVIEEIDRVSRALSTGFSDEETRGVGAWLARIFRQKD